MCLALQMMSKHVALCRGFPCFITACEPNYRDVLAQLTVDDDTPVYLVPYLLFTGILMKEIESEANQARERLRDVRVCRYIGFHPHVKAAYIERVQETILNKEDAFRFQGKAMLPVHLDLTNKHVLIAGGGRIAARRTSALCMEPCSITIVSPDICDEMANLIETYQLTWKKRKWMWKM